MHVHKYEKIWLVASLVLIVGFIVTITYGAVGLGIAMVDDEVDSIDPTGLNDDPRFSEPRVEQVGDGQYEVYVVASQFLFRPDPIEVPADREVTIYLTSADVIHGFEIVGTNVNSMAIPGEVSKMTVVFEEPGEYGIICNEYCGAAHHDMEGTIVVHPGDEFETGGDA